MPQGPAAELSVDLRELNRLELMSMKMTLAPDQPIFTEGEISQCVYLLWQGTVRLSKTSRGKRQILGFAVAGDFLSLPQDANHCSATAVDSIVLYRLSKVALARFMDSSPQLIGAVGDFVRGEVWWSHRQIVLLGRGNPEQKLMAWLFAWRERSRQNGPAARDLLLPMKRQDIAEYLNLTVATVSRTLNDFKRARLIAITPGGIRITDFEAALALARSIDPTIARQTQRIAAISTQVLTRLGACMVSLADRVAASCPQETWLPLVA
jgi:CRP/FNR family transcriptional regulator